MDLTAKEREFLESDAVRRFEHGRAGAFVEYLLDGADRVATGAAVSRTAVVDGLRRLSHNGFGPDGPDAPGPAGLCSMSDYHRLLDGQKAFRRVPGELGVEGVAFRGSAHVPERTLILVDPRAAVPAYPANTDRPWEVRDWGGVVAVEVEE